MHLNVKHFKLLLYNAPQRAFTSIFWRCIDGWWDCFCAYCSQSNWSWKYPKIKFFVPVKIVNYVFCSIRIPGAFLWKICMKGGRIFGLYLHFIVLNVFVALFIFLLLYIWIDWRHEQSAFSSDDVDELNSFQYLLVSILVLNWLLLLILLPSHLGMLFEYKWYKKDSIHHKYCLNKRIIPPMI